VALVWSCGFGSRESNLVWERSWIAFWVSFWVREETSSFKLIEVFDWETIGPWSSFWSMTIRVTPVSWSWFLILSETHRAPLYLGKREK